jgi:leucyl aminopeptidase
VETTLVSQSLDRVEADAVVVLFFEEETAPAELKSFSPWLDELRSSGEFTGKTGELAVQHQPQGLKAKRLAVAGGGKKDKFDAAVLRRAVGTAVRALKQKGVKKLAWFLTGADAEAAVEGAILGNFEPDRHKPSSDAKSLESFILVAPDSARAAFERGKILGEAQNFTRELVNEPANIMTPTLLADRARAMAAEVGLEFEVLDESRMRQLGMGSLLGVSQGSAEPPALIIVRYKPAQAPKTKDHLGLVGKGVTFDTGGVSIKPADGMEKMKYDMAGGAAMIGTMRAIALLKPNIKVIGIVCATENMPSGKAQKPGDVQIAMSGKSIEIINTDAEGRLVLADGLFYARQLGCTHLVDAATLTGACVVALGYVNAGVFANDENMYERFSRALNKAGEKMWRLPLDEEYKESIRSGIADIINSGGRWGGAITAAMFLKEFAEDTPWMHLDIAGTAWMEDNKPWIAKGPSGIAVRSLVEFVRDFANSR